MTEKLPGYFDYAAATPLDTTVFEAMRPYFEEFYNPSALYNPAEDTRRAIDSARRTVADIIGVKHSEIVFTSGCTEANNLAIQGVLHANPGGTVLISAIEHDSVRLPASNFNCTEIPVDHTGIVDLQALEQLITSDVVLVSVVYVNNEMGAVQPLRKIASLIAAERARRGSKGRPIYLHTDAAQAPNIRSIKRSSLGVDMMSLNGAKIYGPKGSGCLFVAGNVKIDPLLYGGGQESGLRSGTENTPAIIGFATALSKTAEQSAQEAKRLSTLKQQLVNGLEHLGGRVISGDAESIVSVLLPGTDNERMVYSLDHRGIAVSSGSACHAKKGEKSHVLHSIGLSDEESQSVIRISMGRYTTEEGVGKLLDSIKQILASS